MRTFLLLGLVTFLTAIPMVASAQNGLVPCGGIGQPECQACHLTILAQNIVKFLVLISATIGAIMFAVAGFRMVMSAGNISEVEAAKGMMTNVVIGFIILLASWLIVDTLMKAFVDGSKFGVWNSIKCEKLPVYAQISPQQLGMVAGGSAQVLAAGPNGTLITQISDVTRQQLAAQGILVNKSACPAGSAFQNVSGGCTTVSGLTQGSVNSLINLKNGCGSNCSVTITGGNEAGHQTHSDGNSVDIRFSSGVNSYIQSHTASQLGMNCVQEADHWHCRQVGT